MVLLAVSASGFAQASPESSSPGSRPEKYSKSLIVFPFENASAVPGIEWIGEAFPEVIASRLPAEGMYVISREDRVHAFERFGIPATLRPSRATLYRIAEEMDADFAVLGRYRFDGQTFTVSAQLLDIKNRRLGTEVSEHAPLPSLMDVSNSVAWDVLHELDANAPSRSTFVSASPSVRLDAFENYVRGITAPTRQEQIRRLKEAVRLAPDYERAAYQLGRAYFETKDYANAITWLTHVAHDPAASREAMFYAGLAAYYLGDYAQAEDRFNQLARRMPLNEVLNDIGAAEVRLENPSALQNFQRAAQNDPNDPDYRYNYALSLYRSGDYPAATRQAREALALRPGDADIKALLDLVSTGTQGSKLPAEHLKRNYDETAFRLAELEVERATEARLATADPATHSQYHLDRGRELLQEGLLAESEKHYREACQLQPNNAAAHAGLATVLEREGSLAQAKVEALAANQTAPSADAYVVMTRLDMHAGDLNAAAVDVQHALDLQPNNASALMLDREIKARRMAAQKTNQN
jgi:tetratricopeptide (TPR) repeat protein/TolB-like protein